MRALIYTRFIHVTSLKIEIDTLNTCSIDEIFFFGNEVFILSFQKSEKRRLLYLEERATNTWMKSG